MRSIRIQVLLLVGCLIILGGCKKNTPTSADGTDQVQGYSFAGFKPGDTYRWEISDRYYRRGDNTAFGMVNGQLIVTVGERSGDKHHLWMTGTLETTNGWYRTADTTATAPVRNDTSRLAIGVTIVDSTLTELDSVYGSARLLYRLFPSEVGSSASETSGVSMTYRGTTSLLAVRWENSPAPTQTYFDQKSLITAYAYSSDLGSVYFGRLFLRRINADTVILNGLNLY